MRMLWLTSILLGALLVLNLTPTSAQRTGLIVEGNLPGESGIGPLNPLLCNNALCERITDSLYPRLLNYDAATGETLPATIERGLAESWDIDGNTVRFHLRTDRYWSDGTPITAYDVYYTYLALTSDDFSYVQAVNENFTTTWLNHKVAAAPLDAQTIAFVYDGIDCNTLSAANFPVIPAHVFEPGFAESISYTGGDIAAWAASQPVHDFSFMPFHPFNAAPTVTGGAFHLDSRTYAESIRLLSQDGSIAYEYADTAAPEYVDIQYGAPHADDFLLDAFLRRDFNLFVSPDYQLRRDLRAAPGVKIQEFPGSQWFYINLNLADPLNPRSAFDENGGLLDQGQHPIFGDVRVRRALQMALDVSTLIDAAVEGDGVPLASNQPPASWAYNADLTPISYDPMGAAHLLDEAGWKDLNQDGLRECVNCLYAEPGSSLAFELAYSDLYSYIGSSPAVNGDRLVNLIQQQWNRVGIGVSPHYTNASDASWQQYDAFLDVRQMRNPVDALDEFTTANDLLYMDELGGALMTANDSFGTGSNTSSYSNAEYDRLVTEARTTPNCAAETRRTLYQQAQAILQTDQPSIWLFSPNRMIAMRGDVDLLPLDWEAWTR